MAVLGIGFVTYLLASGTFTKYNLIFYYKHK